MVFPHSESAILPKIRCINADKHGVRVLGSPIGVDDWVKAQCLSKVGEQMKVQPYFHIIADDLQLTLTLIRKCFQLKLIHLARTAPPLINGAAKLVDSTMVQLIKGLSHIEGYPDEWPMIR